MSRIPRSVVLMSTLCQKFEPIFVSLFIRFRGNMIEKAQDIYPNENQRKEARQAYKKA